ncbi:MAG TPA: serine--tRNA ligase, partial [bacterium]|nr:serine--tRNA ligase [bacterium]
CTDYQSRRLNIRYRPSGGKPRLIHTLNGTAVATSRAIIAVMENYQQKDGSILIPTALQRYMGKERIVAV